ncbi:hypothetical protein OF83DRAFT_718346 [Amylostereum chailletii]|nr:hypothetical protein OF83DRAFT_718346 [Amylostereum chailletii]
MDLAASNETQYGSPKSPNENRTRISWFGLAQERLSQTDSIIHDGIMSAKSFSLAKDLDEELKQLAQMAPIVFAQRNACVPISFLPAEILVHILTLYALNPGDDNKLARTKARRWIVASHVCTRWREIVLGHATAWAEHVFSFAHEYVQDIILKRAGAAPLTLQYYDHQENKEEKRRFDFILQHIDQIKRLDVWIYRHARIARLFQALCSKELPALEELVVEYGCAFDKEPPFFRGTGRAIVAPQLRACTLVSCFQPWNMRSLEDLELRTGPAGGSDRAVQFLPNFTPLLESLRSSPELRRLRITSYLSSAEFQEGQLVHLPLLEKIDITDKTLDHIPAILSCLCLPPSCRADMTCYSGDTLARSEPSEYELIARIIQALAPKDANEASNPSSRPTHLSLFTPARRGDTLHIRIKDHILESLHCTCYLSTTDLARLCSLLADEFHLDHVRSLSLSLPTPDHGDALWQQLFIVFPNVRLIDLHQEDDGPSHLALPADFAHSPHRFYHLSIE